MEEHPTIIQTLIQTIEVHQRLFQDIHGIRPGEDFVKAIEATLSSADCVLVVIGPGWLAAKNERGKPRIEAKADFVRAEVAAAPDPASRPGGIRLHRLR